MLMLINSNNNFYPLWSPHCVFPNLTTTVVGLKHGCQILSSDSLTNKL